MNDWRDSLHFMSAKAMYVIEPNILAAKQAGADQATHYKRSLAQRARWMLAEHLKETRK